LKIAMKNNAKFALKELHDLNPITKLWWNLISSYILTFKILEYIKVVEIAWVIGSVEDERCFFYNILHED
jgi:hypothetical protein